MSGDGATQRRTLVVHTGGIGDFLLTCPTLRLLAEEGPVELLGHRDRLDLAVAGGIAAAAYGLDTVDFDSAFSTPSARLREFLARFDRAVIWMRDEGGELRDAFTECGIADVQTFPGLPPDDWSRHASRYYLSCLGYDAAPPLRLDIKPKGRHDVIIHPGSGDRTHGKNWPLGHYLTLAEGLEKDGAWVEWSLGPAEEAIALPKGRNALGTLSLVSLARHLAAARLYIGNDSGITHLAAAVGCHTVALFRSTNPRIWAPVGEHVTVFVDADTKHLLSALGGE